MKFFTKFIGAIMFLCLLPTIAYIFLDVAHIVMASLPWWVVAGLLVAALLAIIWIVGLTMRLFGLTPRRTQRHDHYHHRGGGW